MLHGVVEGNVVTTTKHRSLKGWRLLIVQPLGADGKADGDPVLAVDSLGAGIGCRVVIGNDGKGTRELVGDNNSPLRWAIMGIDDHG